MTVQETAQAHPAPTASHSSGPPQPSHAADAHGARVEFADVDKRYGSFLAVDRFRLTVEPGEFLTLLGPSGSGKTTSLMLLAGFQTPDGGQILINGTDVSRVPPYRRDQGVVFQNYALFPHMTIAQNLAFPLEARGVAREVIAAKTADALQMVRLDALHDRYPDQLSGGQQQRVALARAIVADPPLLLMDEPLGALDKNLREEMQFEIKRIQRSLRVTVLYVTHDQDEALTMSDRIVVMSEGRIEQVGSPAEIYERPRTRFVAEFVGDTNLLEGRVDGTGGERRFQSADGAVAMPAADWAAGQAGAVQAVVRPEKIAIARAGTPDAAGGDTARARARGRVTEAIYLGQMMRYSVAVGDSVLVVKAMSRADTPVHPAGTEVSVSWLASDFVVLEG